MTTEVFVADPLYDSLKEENPIKVLFFRREDSWRPTLLKCHPVSDVHLHTCWEQFCGRVKSTALSVWNSLTIGVFEGHYVHAYGTIAFKGVFRSLKPHELTRIDLPMRDWVHPMTLRDLIQYLDENPIDGVGWSQPFHHEFETYGSHRLVDLQGNPGDFRVLMKDGTGSVLSPCESFSATFIRPKDFKDALIRVIDEVVKEDLGDRLSRSMSSGHRCILNEDLRVEGLYGDRMRLYMKNHPLEESTPPLTLATIDKDGLFASYLLGDEEAATIPFITEHAPVIEVHFKGGIVQLELDDIRLETLDEAKTAAYKTIYGSHISFIQVRGNFEPFALLNDLVFEKTKHFGLTDYSQTWKEKLKDFFSTNYNHQKE